MSEAIVFKSFRAANQSEMVYAFEQSQQLTLQTTRIGCLRGDFGRGNEFNSTWTDGYTQYKTPEFQREFDEVINALRFQPAENNILGSFSNMERACHSPSSYKIPYKSFGEQFCFRADTEKYSYIIRCLPHKGDYNFYVAAYEKDSLDKHIKRAEKGIRFITSRYDNLFTINDGDLIQITYDNGEKQERVCRYIDECHLEVDNNLFHICQFAEIMESNGYKVVPMRLSLPDECYVYIETEAKIGIVRKGEKGYHLTDFEANEPDTAKELIKNLNAKNGIGQNQAEAMKAGSMFGWDTPAADPKNYDESGTPIIPKHRDRGDAR